MNNTIRFFKNGELIYELQKINNLYILTDIKSNQSKAFNKIPPQLENLLPEGINKELFAIKNNISIHNKFNLLKYLDDVFGRISTTNQIKKEIDFNLQINSYKEAVKYAEDFKIENSLLESLEFSITPKEKKIHLSYLSGQQPKATVVVNDNQIRFADKSEYSNAILKYSNRKYHLINLIENMFLNFARFELNFEVMSSFILIDRQLRKSEFLRNITDTLVIKRFDRKENEYFEINALLGYSSQEKYDLSVEEIFERMKNYLNKEDLLTLGKYYYFNYLIGNGDAHAKNFSVVRLKKEYKLVPLYDIVNTHIYGFKDSLGIPLYKEGFNENFSEEELLHLLGKYIDITPLLQIHKKLKDKIEIYINQTPFNEFEHGEKIRERLINFFENRGIIDTLDMKQKEKIAIKNINKNIKP